MKSLTMVIGALFTLAALPAHALPPATSLSIGPLLSAGTSTGSQADHAASIGGELSAGWGLEDRRQLVGAGLLVQVESVNLRHLRADWGGFLTLGRIVGLEAGFTCQGADSNLGPSPIVLPDLDAWMGMHVAPFITVPMSTDSTFSPTSTLAFRVTVPTFAVGSVDTPPIEYELVWTVKLAIRSPLPAKG